MEPKEIQSRTNHGYTTVSNDWMEDMIAGDVEKRTIWAKVLQSRGEMGYLIFSSQTMPTTMQQMCIKIKNCPFTLNLCTEIMLPSDENWSFVCNIVEHQSLALRQMEGLECCRNHGVLLRCGITEFLEKLERYKILQTRR